MIDLFFMLVLFAMLILVGYAKVQQGVAKTPGTISLSDEEDTLLSNSTK